MISVGSDCSVVVASVVVTLSPVVVGSVVVASAVVISVPVYRVVDGGVGASVVGLYRLP